MDSKARVVVHSWYTNTLFVLLFSCGHSMTKVYVLVISGYYFVAQMHGISKQVGKREVVTVLTRNGSRWCARAVHSSN